MAFIRMLITFLSYMFAKFLLVSKISPFTVTHFFNAFFDRLGNLVGFWVLTWVRIWIVIFRVMTQCNLQIDNKHVGENIALLF